MPDSASGNPTSGRSTSADGDGHSEEVAFFDPSIDEGVDAPPAAAPETRADGTTIEDLEQPQSTVASLHLSSGMGIQGYQDDWVRNLAETACRLLGLRLGTYLGHSGLMHYFRVVNSLGVNRVPRLEVCGDLMEERPVRLFYPGSDGRKEIASLEYEGDPLDQAGHASDGDAAGENETFEVLDGEASDAATSSEGTSGSDSSGTAVSLRVASVDDDALLVRAQRESQFGIEEP